jgi:hypothetical protein
LELPNGYSQQDREKARQRLKRYQDHKKLSENCPNPFVFSAFSGVKWRFRIVSKLYREE